ncbi:MAG: putative viral replication protein [Circoviridae sp.]|nr:MAG: putative viral replication protein [Circoviridae sp.]
MRNRQKQADGEEGNTVPPPQPTRKTFYCFTVFNLTDDSEIELNRQLGTLCSKYLYGKEICPTTGRTHLQGFLHLKKAMRITELKLIGKPHLEACKGSEAQNIKYCSKDGNVVKYGFPKPIVLPNVETYQLHLQWIADHKHYVPLDGVNPYYKSYYDEMYAVYHTTTGPRKIAQHFFDDDLKFASEIGGLLKNYEHNVLY